MTTTDHPRPAIPLERMSVRDVLRLLPPLQHTKPEEIEALAAATSRVRKAADSVVLAEGQMPDGLYVVLRGRVNLVRTGDGGRDLILMSLGPGEAFGESCAFDRAGMTTAAIAPVASDLLRIPTEAVVEHVRREPATLMYLLRLLHDKLDEIEGVASSLALCDVEERLRRTLARLVRRQGRRAPGTPGWILAPVPTQSELARMVGSCRETVSRTLSAMARNGLVSSSGRRMVLDDRLMHKAVAVAAA